jgi:hypothetical protein
MKQHQTDVFDKIEVIAKHVLSNLKDKGYAVPVQEKDGSITFNGFTVRKTDNFYSIIGKNNAIIADRINLPQSAALLANGLALGHIVDSDLIKLDTEYGYKQFDEELYLSRKKRKKNTLDQVIFYEMKYEMAKVRKNEVKNRILQSFRKLTSIR